MGDIFLKFYIRIIILIQVLKLINLYDFPLLMKKY